MGTPTIVAAVDFSALSQRAARLAAAVAARRGARLALVHATPSPLLAAVTVEPMFVPPQWLDALRRRHDHEVAGKLRWLAERLHECHPTVAVDDHIRLAEPHDGIAEAAAELGAELIVMATRSARASRFLLGSVAAKVVLRAPCPVLVADHGGGEEPTTHFRHAVVGIDYSPLSRPLVELAAAFVDRPGQLELTHVWHEPHLGWLVGHPEREQVLAAGLDHARRRLAHFVGEVGADHPGIAPRVETGEPAAALLERAAAGGADLIVVGAHRHRGGRGLGTVADRVLRHATAAVLVLPAAPIAGPAADLTARPGAQA